MTKKLAIGMFQTGGVRRTWLAKMLCMTVKSHARRSLPTTQSRHLLQARSRVSCTRSSAAHVLPVSARA